MDKTLHRCEAVLRRQDAEDSLVMIMTSLCVGGYALLFVHAIDQIIERLQRDVDRLSFDRELMMQEAAEARRQCAEMNHRLSQMRAEHAKKLEQVTEAAQPHNAKSAAQLQDAMRMATQASVPPSECTPFWLCLVVFVHQSKRAAEVVHVIDMDLCAAGHVKIAGVQAGSISAGRRKPHASCKVRPSRAPSVMAALTCALQYRDDG